jgi:hypothetical protein
MNYMAGPLTQEEINVKFNLQKYLKMGIDDNDIERIGQVLNLKADYVSERIRGAYCNTNAAAF